MPDILLIGAPKCGTTWLARRLAAHPAIAMAAEEIHYFSRHYARGPGWYARQLPSRPPGGLVGENSNSYLTDPAAWPRILADAPQARLLCVLRDPVARAYSSYGMQIDRGRATADIARYLNPARTPLPHIIANGEYGRMLAPLIAAGARDRLLVLFLDDIVAAPAETLSRILAALGVAADHLPAALATPENARKASGVPGPLKRLLWPLRPLLATPALRPLRDRATALLGRRKAYPPLDPAIAERLAHHYAPDLARLEALLERPLPNWAAATVPVAKG